MASLQNLLLNPRSYIYSSNAETLVLQSAAPQSRLSFFDASSPDGFRYFVQTSNQQLSINTMLANQTVTAFSEYKTHAGTPMVHTYGTNVMSNLIISRTSPQPSKLVTLYDYNSNSAFQYTGFGVQGSSLQGSFGTSLVYQTPTLTGAHVFKAAFDATSNLEIMRVQLNAYLAPLVSIGGGAGAAADAATSNLALQVLGNTSIQGELSVNNYNINFPSFVQVDPSTQRVSSNVLPQGVVYATAPNGQIDASLIPPQYSGSYMRTYKNVGIGTRTPVQLLHVEGTEYVAGRVGIGTSQPASRIHAVESAAVIPTALLYNTVGGDILHSYVSSNGVQLPAMCIVATGAGNTASVGIATDAVLPANALQVNGNTSSISVTTGDLTANGAVLFQNAPFVASDSRMKYDIRQMPDAPERLGRIHGYTYNTYYGRSGRHAGVLAQEVSQVLPEAVSMSETGYMAVAYDSLVPLMIEAINTLTQRVANLESMMDCTRG